MANSFRKISNNVRRASNGRYKLLYRLTKTWDPATDKIERIESFILRSSSGADILHATKVGRKHLNVVMDTQIRFQEMLGTPFEAMLKEVTYTEFESFLVWYVTSGYYYKKTSPRPMPISLNEIEGLEVKPLGTIE